MSNVGSLCSWHCCAGQTRSEGGFKENKVSAASVLGLEEGTDKKGKLYYRYEMLVRTGEIC